MVRFSAEWWVWWAGVAGAGLTLAAAAAGIVVWIASNIAASKAEERTRAADERTRTLELRLSEQRELTANAERDAAAAKQMAASAGEGTAKALADVAAANQRTERLAIEAAQYQERAAIAERNLLTKIEETTRPRDETISIQALINASADKPRAKLVVLYQPDDPEAYLFSLRLFFALKEAMWPTTTDSPYPIPPDLVAAQWKDSGNERIASLPAAVRAGGSTLYAPRGAIIIPAPDTSDAAATLYGALQAGVHGLILQRGYDPALEPGTIRLIIAPK